MHLKSHKNNNFDAIALRFPLLLLMTASWCIKTTLSDTSERIDVNVADCRKLEVYYQCKVSGLNIMESDRYVAINLNIPNQPNDIRIESSNMSFIPAQFFRALVDLKEFVAINCSIRAIFHDTFASASKLHYLVLSHNNIDFIAENAFKNASDLQSLKLDSNRIEILGTNVFRGLDSLRTLKLSSNRIAYLPLYIFHDLANLETLDISENRIRVISAGQFATNSQLQQIDFSENQISIIDSGTFDDLTNVQRINLEQNVCVNASIGSQSNATEMLSCCVPESSEELCSRGSNGSSTDGISTPVILLIFVALIGNITLVVYLMNNRTMLRRTRNRDDQIELVRCESEASSYQVF